MSLKISLSFGLVAAKTIYGLIQCYPYKNSNGQQEMGTTTDIVITSAVIHYTITGSWNQQKGYAPVRTVGYFGILVKRAFRPQVANHNYCVCKLRSAILYRELVSAGSALLIINTVPPFARCKLLCINITKPVQHYLCASIHSTVFRQEFITLFTIASAG